VVSADLWFPTCGAGPARYLFQSDCALRNYTHGKNWSINMKSWSVTERVQRKESQETDGKLKVLLLASVLFGGQMWVANIFVIFKWAVSWKRLVTTVVDVVNIQYNIRTTASNILANV